MKNSLRNTLGDIALRAINRVMFVKVLKGVVITTVNEKYLRCDPRYCGQFITAAALHAHANDPVLELGVGFLKHAVAAGEECYAFLRDGHIASYGWYSNQPTEIDVPGLTLDFNPDYMYMFKGLTHPDHRGLRLHAIGMTRALDSYLSRGLKGLVSYVEWNNFDSLKSCYRMGYSDFGNLYIVRLFGRYWLGAGAGCRRYGFRLREAVREPEEVIRMTA